MSYINIKNAISFEIIKESENTFDSIPNGMDKNKFNYIGESNKYKSKPVIIVYFEKTDRTLYFDDLERRDDFINQYLPEFLDYVYLKH
jgi:hypothetical protein